LHVILEGIANEKRDMPKSSVPHESRIVVGFRNRRSSLEALRWAIEAARAGGVPLRVVHATNAGVAVVNGPSSAVAHQLGGPTWATVHSLVQGLGAPAGTETIVETGSPAAVLGKHIDSDDVVVLGKRKRFGLGRNLSVVLKSQQPCTVIRVAQHDVPTVLPIAVDADQDLVGV